MAKNKSTSSSTSNSKALAAPTENSKSTGGSKLVAFLAITAGLLIMFAGYSVYRHFDKTGMITEEPIATVDLGTVDTKGILPVEEGDSEGIIALSEGLNQSGIEQTEKTTQNLTNDTKKPLNEETKSESEQKSVSQTSATGPSTSWTPNNYNKGDITSNTHQVVSGDTLWEIAEGAYGDGTQWHKIAQANDVGYLSNGNPLIIPGQMLTIP